MSAPDEKTVGLRPAKPPGAARIIAWLFVVNVIMVMASTVVLSSASKMIGADWMENLDNLALLLGGFIVVVVGSFLAVFFKVRRDSRIVARLDRSGGGATIRGNDGEAEREVPEAELQWREVQLYEQDGDQPYPAGPGVELLFGKERVVIVNRDIRGRWAGDVPTVKSADWSAYDEDWAMLLELFPIDNEIKAY